jgi:carbon monoxide dehydrogenase subunit G
MQLHLEGSNSLNASRDRVYALLTDPNFIAKNLPDSEDVRVLDDHSLEGKMKLKIAVVSTSLRMKMSLERTSPPEKAALKAEGTGSGSTLKISSIFELSGGTPTEMAWSADAEISGVMAGMGATLLKGFATKKVAEIFADITGAIERSAT